VGNGYSRLIGWLQPMRLLALLYCLPVLALVAIFGYGAVSSLFEEGDNATRRGVVCLAFLTLFIGIFVIGEYLQRRSDREARSLLAQFPGPVTISLHPERHLFMALLNLALAGGMAIAAHGSGPYKQLFGICVAAFFLFGAFLAVWVMARGSSLTLTDRAFETEAGETPKSREWTEVGSFRAIGSKVRRVSFNRAGTPGIEGSILFRWDLETLPDNYGLGADSLAWLMNEWRAKAMAAPPAPRTSATATRASRSRGKSLLDHA
jgi:hypothetical protein